MSAVPFHSHLLPCPKGYVRGRAVSFPSVQHGFSSFPSFYTLFCVLVWMCRHLPHAHTIAGLVTTWTERWSVLCSWDWSRTHLLSLSWYDCDQGMEPPTIISILHHLQIRPSSGSVLITGWDCNKGKNIFKLSFSGLILLHLLSVIIIPDFTVVLLKRWLPFTMHASRKVLPVEHSPGKVRVWAHWRCGVREWIMESILAFQS